MLGEKAGRVKPIVSIQLLRAVAALAVVLSHSQFDLGRFAGLPDTLRYFNLGNAGVDLFFVISGFVMVYASEPLFGRSGGAFNFFSHRVIRIVPLYWLVTTFYLGIALSTTEFARSYSLAVIVASYVFVPLPRSDGIMEPIVGQGWSLNYELFFYLIFAFAVFAPRRSAVSLVTCALVVSVVLGRLLTPLPVTLAFWSDPIVLEFALGMLLGVAYREGLKLAQPLAIVFVVSGFALLGTSELFGRPEYLRFLTWGGPAALVVAGATFGRFELRQSGWRILVIVGNASYALYLIHPAPIRAILLLARSAHFDLAHALWLYFPAAVIVPVVLAIATHYLFERPVTAALRRFAASTSFGKREVATEAGTLPAEWKSL